MPAWSLKRQWNASPLQYNHGMKTATLPPIRVEPVFRGELEGVLLQGETISGFVESAVRASVQKRVDQAEFVQRGIASIQEAKHAGNSVAAELVIAKLEAKLAAARRANAQPGG